MFRRTPKDYSGIGRTSHKLSDILPDVLEKLCRNQGQRGDLILAAWPEIIGQPLAGMTEAIGFNEGILTVKVHNSTLYSLLNGQDKWRILKTLQRRFPSAEIRNLFFRMR